MVGTIVNARSREVLRRTFCDSAEIAVPKVPYVFWLERTGCSSGCIFILRQTDCVDAPLRAVNVSQGSTAGQYSHAWHAAPLRLLIWGSDATIQAPPRP